MKKIYKIEGQCHCGNISYSLLTKTPVPNHPVRTCTCSFCKKQGPRYISDPEGELLVRVNEKERIIKYEFGTQTAKFVVCGCCGVMPMVISKMENQYYGVINGNTLNDEANLTNDIQLADYEGETLEERENRRKQNWIASVHGVSYFFNL